MSDRRGPVGTGGWLAVLLIMLGVVAPLWYLYLVHRSLGIQAARAGSGALVPWDLRVAIWGSCLLKVAIALTVVWRMLRIRRRTTIRLALAGIWMLAIGMVFVDLAATLLVGVARLDKGLMLLLGWLLAIGLLQAVPLTAYLLRSRRVANTYPACEEGLVQTFE